MALIEFDGVELQDPDVVEAFGREIDETFEELYAQHVAFVRSIARASTTNHADAEDVTAEVFSGLLLALRNGRGPVERARPYLRACVRHEIARARVRGGRNRLVDTDPNELDTALDDEQHLTEETTAERALIASAFSTLSRRHRMVLVATEVEGRSHADLSRELRMSVTAIAALAKRAREAFAQAYLDEHLSPATGECRAIRGTLSAMVRGTVTPRRRRRAYDHLQQCVRCATVHDDLAHVNKMLRSLPAAVLAGSSGMAGGGAAGGFAALKSLLGIGGGSSGPAGGAVPVAGGLGAAGLGVSGFAGIQQVATVATLALGAMMIAGESSRSTPDETPEAAAVETVEIANGRGADAAEVGVGRAAQMPSMDGRSARDLPLRSKTRVHAVPAGTDQTQDDAPRDDRAGAGVGQVRKLRSVHEPIDRAVPAPAAPGGNDHAPAIDPDPAQAPVPPASSGEPAPSTGGAQPPPATSEQPPPTTRVTPPSGTEAPPPPAPGPVKQATEDLNEAVDGVTDAGSDVVRGVTDSGADAVDDLGAQLDEVLEAAGLPPLAEDLTQPVSGTVRTVGDVVDEGLELVDGTVIGVTDLLDAAAGQGGVVGLDALLNQLLGP